MKTASNIKNKTVVKVFGVTFTLDKGLDKYAKYIPKKVQENEKYVANSDFKF
jgi:hypothetical protein